MIFAGRESEFNVTKPGYFTTLNTQFSTFKGTRKSTSDIICVDEFCNNVYMTGSFIGTGTLNLLAPTINIGITGTNVINIGGTGTSINLSKQIPVMVSTSFTGASSFIVPAGITRLEVEAWGPGGGGAGSTPSLGVGGNGGGGGGAGGYVKALVNVTPAESVTITVGNGGARGGLSSNGLPGSANTTVAGTFGTITAGLGSGGGSFGPGGAGGSASVSGSGYVFNFPCPGPAGRDGLVMTNSALPSFFVNLTGGNGGASAFGGSNSGLSTSTLPGAGGDGGSVTDNFTTASVGFAGSNGLVIISYLL